MITKIKTMGQIGKAFGYIMWGINSTARIAGSVVSNVSNGLTNKGLFNISLTTDSGQVVKELTNQTGSQVAEIIEQMDNFGIHSIDIQKVNGDKNDNSK